MLTRTDAPEETFRPPYIEAFTTCPARIEAAITAALSDLDRGWQIYLSPWTGEKPTRELPAFNEITGEPVVLWDKSTDRATVREAFEVWQDDGLIALATGPKSGVMVVRVRASTSRPSDDHHGPYLPSLLGAFEKFAIEHGLIDAEGHALGATSSGDGYWNYFFNWPANLKSIPKNVWKDKIKPGLLSVLKQDTARNAAAIDLLNITEIEEIEILGDGDQLLLPPTIGMWWGEDGCREHEIGDAPTSLLVAFGLMKPLPAIRIVSDGLSEVATLGERALKNSGVPIYQRSGALVYPIVTEVDASHGRRTKVAQLEKIETPYLRDQLRLNADWLRYDKRDKEWVPCNPPQETAVTILSRKGRWTFLTIAGVITTQTMRPDGSLLLQPGFDKATRLLLIDPPELPPIPERPTREDALKALELLEDLISEFRFADEADQDQDLGLDADEAKSTGVDRSVALSGLITPVVRGAFTVAPMHAARAPVMSSGKSYLWDIAASIAIGQKAMPVISKGANEEETEKRLGAALLAGQPLISIDNVNGELRGDALCQIIERPIVEIRILGKSELVRIEARGTTIYCTGNNIVIVGDLVRRQITTSIDPRMTRPELRKFNFKPVEKVLADRGKYIAACLTICRAYFVAGRPDKAPALASFEEWSDVVRSALKWLGKTDPIQSMEVARENDPELGALRDVVTVWSEKIGIGRRHECTLVEVIAGINKFTEFNSVMQNVVGKPRIPTDVRSLAYWLRDHKGRMVRVGDDDLRFVSKTPRKGGAATWWIEGKKVKSFEGPWWQVQADPADAANDERPEPPPAEPPDDEPVPYGEEPDDGAGSISESR